MVIYQLYIEGGGRPDPESGQMIRAAMIDSNAEAFRRGWRTFFNKAGVNGQILEIRVGGGQEQSFKGFSAQLARYSGQEGTVPKPLLLVDSEEQILAGHTVWQHLQTRSHNKFQRPMGADDESAYMMVQAMETWFIADLPALHHFFGTSFDASDFEGLPELEGIPKEVALNMLRHATHRCKRHYTKRRAFDLLAYIDPETVARACSHAEQLLNYLRSR